MALLITLGISIILQFFAAIVSIRLTRVTKYNLSWILITFAFIFMAIQRTAELLPFISETNPQEFRIYYTWLGAITSLFFAVGVFLIQKIFSYMKKVEQQTRDQEKALLKAVIQAEERERQRFATEIHDGLGPLLSTIKLSVSSLEKGLNTSTSDKIIHNTQMIVNECIKSVQEISNNLSPHILKNFGVAKAIRNFAHKISQCQNLQINFISNAFNKRFAEVVETLVYRAVCELINNALKHAHASKVDISLQAMDALLTINYKDNGIGFNTAKIYHGQQNMGTGYYNLIHRIESLKGTVSIESGKEQSGVQVTITIPIHNEK